MVKRTVTLAVVLPLVFTWSAPLLLAQQPADPPAVTADVAESAPPVAPEGVWVPSCPPPQWRDWEIREDIELRLAYNPLVDAGSVGVCVRQGVATLSGTVRSAYERDVAARSAARTRAERIVVALRVRRAASITYVRPEDLPTP